MRFLNTYVCLSACMACAFAAAPELTIEIKDYATMPITGAVDGTEQQCRPAGARSTFSCRSRAYSKKRLFVNDVNGPLYILDKDTKKLTTYLDFNGLAGQPGIFHRLAIDQPLASGFISFQFDPDYAHNGKFYTIHMEDPALPASSLPDNKNFPGFKTAGYTATPAIRTFGDTQRESVIVEWTDTDISNCNIRRHGPRVDAAAVQRPHSSDGRSDFQSDGAAGRPRLACHVYLQRRRRRRASSGPTFAAIRSASIRWWERSCESYRTSKSKSIPARSARTAATASPRQSVRREAGRPERNLGVRFTQSVPAELGRRPGESRQ